MGPPRGNNPGVGFRKKTSEIYAYNKITVCEKKKNLKNVFFTVFWGVGVKIEKKA